MKVNIKLAGAFRIDRFKEEVREYPTGTSVRKIVDSLLLPEQILGIVLINGVHAEFDDILQDCDTLSILPVLDGG